ncbi:MAG: YEATS-associated helix-containing protein [Thiobacillaceae bacterium]
MQVDIFPAVILTLISIAAGLLGGIINYFQSRSDSESVSGLPYYLLLSTCAAFIVPLFLSLAKSQILSNIFSPTLKLEDWFVYFGACVLVAIYAKSFLETVSKKFLDELKGTSKTANQALETANQASHQAETTLNQVEGAMEKLENRPGGAVTKALVVRASPDVSRYGPDEQEVLKALMDPAYPLARRSLGGIASATKLSRQTVTNCLDHLIDAQVVKKVEGEKTGSVFYELLDSSP